MRIIKVNNQKLEILGLSSTSKIAKDATVYVVKKSNGTKLGKLFIRENGFKHTYLFGQLCVNFDTFEVVA